MLHLISRSSSPIAYRIPNPLHRHRDRWSIAIPWDGIAHILHTYVPKPARWTHHIPWAPSIHFRRPRRCESRIVDGAIPPLLEVSNAHHPSLRPFASPLARPNQHTFDRDVLERLHAAVVSEAFGTGAAGHEQEMGFAGAVRVVVRADRGSLQASQRVLRVFGETAEGGDCIVTQGLD